MTPELHWRKSSYSGENGACIEIADLPDGGAAMRDSKNPGPVLPVDVRALLTAVKAGHLDR
jgi:hypothetical protein